MDKMIATKIVDAYQKGWEEGVDSLTDFSNSRQEYFGCVRLILALYRSVKDKKIKNILAKTYRVLSAKVCKKIWRAEKIAMNSDLSQRTKKNVLKYFVE